MAYPPTHHPPVGEDPNSDGITGALRDNSFRRDTQTAEVICFRAPSQLVTDGSEFVGGNVIASPVVSEVVQVIATEIAGISAFKFSKTQKHRFSGGVGEKGAPEPPARWNAASALSQRATAQPVRRQQPMTRAGKWR